MNKCKDCKWWGNQWWPGDKYLDREHEKICGRITDINTDDGSAMAQIVARECGALFTSKDFGCILFEKL